MSKFIKAFIGLGSNLGNRMQNLRNAVKHIGEENNIIAISSVYANPAMGFESDTDFYNAVIAIETKKSPQDLLQFLKSIEKKLGRKKNNSGKYESRIIDLDILDFNGEIYDSSELVVPHKEMHSRGFVVIPLLEISPDWIHPVFNKNLIQLAAQSAANDLLVKLDEKIGIF